MDKHKSVDELEKVINYHKLDGINLLANEALTKELEMKLGKNGRLSLPAYALLSRDGQIINGSLSRPSQWENLKLEIQNAMQN